MKTLKLIFFAAMALIAASCSNAIQSPDKALRAEVEGQSFTVYYGDAQVFANIHVGLVTETANLDSALVLKSVSCAKKVVDDYIMLTGKRSHCTNSATERTYTYDNPEGESLKVIVRLYNDGFALRYVTEEGVTVVEDKTSYSIADGVNRWITPYDYGNEQPFPHSTNGGPVKARAWYRPGVGEWGYPALVEPQEGVFALLAEADLRRGDSGSRLDNAADPEVYQVKLLGPAVFNGGMSPWRCAIIGKLSDIVESTLITELSTPSQVADTDWIKPGVSSWIYWAYNHGSKDFNIIKDYIDLAVEMEWPYCLVDWEWPQMENGDINDVLAYAKERNIKINLWYNSGTSWVGESAPQPQDRLNTAENREEEMAWLENLGASGIKVDFFSAAAADMVNYYIDILEDAAKHHLTIDFHGCTIPNGWQRTWPNMMSMEGIYGAEWYNNGPFFTGDASWHNATVPYTRNVIGPMDYTPGSFTDSQFSHITTNTHELALPVLFESGLQHMADRPAGYAELPEQAREVYKTLPAVWDDTKLLAGYPGESAVIARRSGSKWYIAGINGKTEPVDLTFSLERLGLNDWSSILFTDSDEDRVIAISELQAENNNVSIPCRARGGFLAVIQ